MSYIPKGAWQKRQAEAMAALAGREAGGWQAAAGEDTRREKVTLRLPAWVLDYFRGLGPGYQGRIALVLAGWVAGQRGDAAAGGAGDLAAKERALAQRRETIERAREAARIEGARYRAEREREIWGPEGRPADPE